MRSRAAARRGQPLGALVELGAGPAHGQEDLGGDDEHRQRRGELTDPVAGAAPGYRHQGDRDRGECVEDQRRKEGHPQGREARPRAAPRRPRLSAPAGAGCGRTPSARAALEHVGHWRRRASTWPHRSRAARRPRHSHQDAEDREERQDVEDERADGQSRAPITTTRAIGRPPPAPGRAGSGRVGVEGVEAATGERRHAAAAHATAAGQPGSAPRSAPAAELPPWRPRHRDRRRPLGEGGRRGRAMRLRPARGSRAGNLSRRSCSSRRPAGRRGPAAWTTTLAADHHADDGGRRRSSVAPPAPRAGWWLHRPLELARGLRSGAGVRGQGVSARRRRGSGRARPGGAPSGGGRPSTSSPGRAGRWGEDGRHDGHHGERVRVRGGRARW